MSDIGVIEPRAGTFGGLPILCGPGESPLEVGVTWGLVREALQRSDPSQLFASSLTVDMWRRIGVDICVPTTGKDETFYALSGANFKRFVRNRRPVPTRQLDIWMMHFPQEAHYRLFEVHFGQHRPAPPIMRMSKRDPRYSLWCEIQERSRAFWSTHAYVDGSLPYEAGTERTTCPWPRS